MSVAWNNKDIQERLEASRERQEEYYKFLGRYSWVQYKSTEHYFLKRNIGFALFGCPSEPDESEELIGYNEKQCELIDELFELIKGTKKEHQDKNNIWVSFLFVCCKIDENHVDVAVIRVPKNDVTSITNSNMFIDSSLRVYENWDDFLKNNMLPDCLMCYPSGGQYIKLSNQLQLGKQVSPEGTIRSKVLKQVDLTTTVVQAASIGVGVASLFVPMAWPILAGIAGVNLATGGYTAGRSIAQLRDREVHQQSIGLGNAESLSCYLGVVGGAFGIASGGVVATATRAAQTGGALTLAAGTSYALGAANGILNSDQNASHNDDDIGLSIFQVVLSVLFYINSVITSDQANMLINTASANNTSILTEILNLANETDVPVGGIGKIVHLKNLGPIKSHTE